MAKRISLPVGWLPRTGHAGASGERQRLGEAGESDRGYRLVRAADAVVVPVAACQRMTANGRFPPGECEVHVPALDSAGLSEQGLSALSARLAYGGAAIPAQVQPRAPGQQAAR